MKGRFSAALLAALATGCTTPSGESSTTQKPVAFVCDRSDALKIAFGSDSAVVISDVGEVRLQSQPVASGFAYAGGGQAIRGKGPELTWTKADGTTRTCREEQWAMRQPQVQPPAPSITGSQWVLVGFQSSDDAIGRVIPPKPERYTLEFATDGKLAARLDCNRAAGTWIVTSQSETGGTLEIKGGAMTRAMCGPGAIDSRIAADLGRIRSYTLRGDSLFLALEADAGIYEFKRSGD